MITHNVSLKVCIHRTVLCLFFSHFYRHIGLCDSTELHTPQEHAIDFIPISLTLQFCEPTIS